MVYLSKIVEDTLNIAYDLAYTLTGGEVILLNGDLGAGKTTFTKGLAVALGITDNVVSPTYTIMKEYEGRLKLYHYDMYRINDIDELYELGIDEYLYSDGVAVIEWNKYEKIHSKKIIIIDIEYMGENIRKITVNRE